MKVCLIDSSIDQGGMIIGVLALILQLIYGMGINPDLVFGQASCTPTASDMEGPYYVPGAPVRSKIGSGLIVKGSVKSSADCSLLQGARIEWWQVNQEGVYDDAHRATQFTGESGGYTIETHVPVSYFRRPPHIHVKVFASGHKTLTTQIYPKANQGLIEFDFVLRKE